MVICVYGAGSVGCYVGGRLAAAGSDVVFIGRERVAKQIAGHGLTLTDWRGAELRVPEPRYETNPDALAAADLVLVTGMVAFNVINRGGGAFHCATEGDLEVQRHPALTGYATEFERAGVPLVQRDDMAAVLAAKLLLNLNNAVNALSGLPLREELSQRAYRRCLALAQREALGAFAAAGTNLVKLTPLRPQWMPTLLGVPDFVFRRVAGRMLAIDPLARSSMWEDLEAGRTTEVDYLNGEIVALARKHGTRAPVNEHLVALIRQAENRGRRDWTGEELLAELTRR